ncbi:MAG TPA: aerial mycelium formation protein [Mycobacteriales bacterium]|nr:aerial mycelium formation protein [Mycobacteriales bacterium]
MTSETTGQGNRRIDRVLDPGFLDQLKGLSLEEVRSRRDEAVQEEVDLSYTRRLLQGRIDILNAELRRRTGDGSASVVDDLAQILADEDRPAARGLGRYITAEPSRADAHRRHVEALVADVDLSDVSARSDEELRQALETFAHEERVVSETRHTVQVIADNCASEIARRYRDGEADVANLLPTDAGEQ